MLQNIWSCRHTHLLVLRQMVIMNTFTRDLRLMATMDNSIKEMWLDIIVIILANQGTIFLNHWKAAATSSSENSCQKTPT